MNKHKQHGFTIVELLIVIVVIAILVAITIVAYNGISDRSINSSYMSALSQSEKSISAYINTKGSYPFENVRSCITESPCYYGSALSVRNELRANLSEISPLADGLKTWSQTYGGIFYEHVPARTYNGDPHPLVLVYFLKGSNLDCGRTVANTLSSTITTSTNKYTTTIGNTTMCVYPFPSKP